MRVIVSLALLGIAGPALSQSLDGSLGGGIQSGLTSGLGASGIQSGLDGSIGSRQQGRTRARLEENGFSREGACAPSQLDLNHTGCRPVREFTAGSISNYDLSIQAMRPISGLQLQGQTLDLGRGPAEPLD